MKIDITVHSHDGFTLSCIVNDCLVHMRYVGYTKREAIKRFKEYIKTL